MSDEKVTRQMGKLLRQGAALLNEACPKCNTPLLRLQDGSKYCTKCDKIIKKHVKKPPKRKRVKKGNEVLNQLATKVLVSLDVLTQSLPDNPHPEEIRTFAAVAKDLVEILKALQGLER